MTGLLLAGALWANAATLDPSRSAAGAVATLAACQGRVRGCCGGWRRDLVIAWREPKGEVQACSMRTSSGRFKNDGPSGTTATLIDVRPKRHGSLWAPVFHTTEYRLLMQVDGPATAQEHAEFRAVMYDFLMADQDSNLSWSGAPATLRAGDVTVRVFNPGGLVQNLLALVNGVALVAWVVRRVRDGRARTLGQMRLERGLCPACGYSMAGLEGRVCPECGGITG